MDELVIIETKIYEIGSQKVMLNWFKNKDKKQEKEKKKIKKG